MKPRSRLGLTSWAAGDVDAAVVSGLTAGIAYAAVQEIDLWLTGRNVDDLAVLGRFFVRDRRLARVIGLGLHLANAVALALIYARVANKLPGPPAACGALFATVENVVLYPITLLEDKHPGIRDGSIARYRTWPAFAQSIPRHIVYGAVLGVLFNRLRRKPSG